MELQEFLKQPHKAFSEQSVACFVADSYPLLFISLLLQRLYNLDLSVVRLNVQMQSQQAIQAQLETSFLGSAQCFWLGNLDALSAKQQAWWLAYIKKYTGPNKILVSITQQMATSCALTKIRLPEKINRRVYALLFKFFVGRLYPMDERRIDELYAKTDALHLDAASLLLHYLQVLGRDGKFFFNEWLYKLVVPQASLFSLSQYLFAQQTTLFMRQWSRMQDLYPAQFWVAYWSEQFWRATWYCTFMKQKKVAQAKKVGYRMPFSFLQKDYRRYKPAALQQIHKELYTLDYALKHGGDTVGLDLLLYRFLLKGAD